MVGVVRNRMGWRSVAAALALALLLTTGPVAAQQGAAGSAAAQEDPAARVEALDKQMVELHRQGRFAEAIPLAAELLSLYERALGAEHPNVATAAINLALLYQRAGRPRDAEPLYQRALAIREKVLGPDHADVAAVRAGLTELYRQQGRSAELETLQKRTLANRETALGPDHPEVAQSLADLAQQYVAQGRDDEAEPLLKRSLAVREQALGPEHAEVGATLEALGALYTRQRRFADAEPLLKRSLAIAEALGPEHPDVGARLAALAALYAEQGRFADAEPLYKRSLALREKTLGPDHASLGPTLDGLAAIYRKQGSDAAALPLLLRSLAIKQRALGADHADVGAALDEIAGIHVGLGDLAAAEPLYKRSLAIRETRLGAEHREVAATLNALGTLTRELGRPADAEPLLRRALAIREKTAGAEHPEVAASLLELGGVYQTLKRPADAERAYQRSLAIFEKAYGPEQPSVALSLDGLAWVRRAQNKQDAALADSKRAVDILAKRIAVDRADAAARGRRDALLRNIALIHAAGSSDALAETFRTAQLARAAREAGPAWAIAERIAAGTDELAAATKKRQGLVKDWGLLDQVLIENAAKPADARNLAEEAEARRYRTDIARELAEADARIAKEQPRFAALVQPQPVTLAAAQALLTPDEALLGWTVGTDETWLWVLRRNRAAMHRIARGERALAEEVGGLRAQLDPALNPGLKPFDATRAHALYQIILEPAAPMLEGASHVFVVPDGPLESLPLGVLVTRPPRADPVQPADHRAPAWFMLRHAISVLPSIGTLAALRPSSAATKATTAFVGFGDPALDGPPGAARAVKLASLFQGALADVEAVRKLGRLPEAAGELRALAKAAGGFERDLNLGVRATEPIVRRAGLERFRVIGFGTYGLVAGTRNGAVEPALVLTPPERASAEDDGLLTASKIATLKLDAEAVVVSASSTAAADGTPDAGGLAALATAFVQAGARSMMASHWPATTDATAKLLAATFEAAKQDRTIGRAEALRRGQLQMLHPSSPPEHAHPSAWATMVLMGEGGSGR